MNKFIFILHESFAILIADTIFPKESAKTKEEFEKVMHNLNLNIEIMNALNGTEVKFDGNRWNLSEETISKLGESLDKEIVEKIKEVINNKLKAHIK